jgi:hypothetical protein
VNLNWDLPHAQGLALDCNLMETGSAPFDAANSRRVPSWTRLDLGARYALRREKPLQSGRRSKTSRTTSSGFRSFPEDSLRPGPAS